LLYNYAMKRIVILFLFISSFVFASSWKLRDLSLTTENDADFRTDRDYTYGSEIGVLYQTQKNHYLSFHIAHQMFTPENFDKEDANLSNERPYAGYMYIAVGLHNVFGNTLDSLTVQTGFVGPSVHMDAVQRLIHSIIGSPDPKGWNDQIKDEAIIQINYEKRVFLELQNNLAKEENLVLYGGGNLGNTSTKATIGAFYRVGEYMQKDFAPRRIDYRGYGNIPLSSQKEKLPTNGWSFGLWAEGSYVLRDIFLDGNTFKESVHVTKKPVVLKGGFLLSYRYKALTIDYLRTYSTKEFTTQDYYHSYGTLHFGYRY